MSAACDGGEDADDSSSVSDGMKKNIRSALDEFREKWQNEIKTEAAETKSETTLHVTASETAEANQGSSDEFRAEELFMKGVEYERRGKVYDALMFYRKAMQIVPDIEFKIYESAKTKMLQTSSPEKNNNAYPGLILDHENDNIKVGEDEDLSNVDLFSRFEAALSKNDRLIERSNAEKGTITTSAHISDLPMELMLYILKWTISSQLDIRSLEQCAAVCKGFYLCARDAEIWRLCCLKVWGVNTGLLKSFSYNTWRQMFLERDRVHFNGCYISKTSYIRYGENSFQDQFYRPVQLVVYYRYFRFLPDGEVLVLTSADEPFQCVGKLKNTNQLRPDVLKGHYRLHGDLVIIVLKKNARPQHYNAQKKRGASSEKDNGEINTFYIEFKIVKSSKRRFCQLQWNHYSIIQLKNKREFTTEFEITNTKYPPLWFSVVKSYHMESDDPLQ